MNQLKCERGIIDLQAVEIVPHCQIDKLDIGTPILYTISKTDTNTLYACIVTTVTNEFKQSMKQSTLCTVYKFKNKTK